MLLEVITLRVAQEKCDTHDYRFTHFLSLLTTPTIHAIREGKVVAKNVISAIVFS